MGLKGLLYRKLKEKEGKDAKSEPIVEEKLENSIKGTATYWGGHLRYPPSKSGEYGHFILDDETFAFERLSLLLKKIWEIKIPLNKIIWEEVSQGTMEDFQYKQRMAAVSYFATGLPVTSYSSHITYLTIPYKDEKNIIQKPRFAISNKKSMKKVSEFLFEKIPKRNEKKEGKIEDPMKVLKLRYANGEITKKEFEEMKKDLQE